MPASALPFARHVETYGFAVVERVFGAEEIDSFSQAIDHAPLVRSRAGARHAMRLTVVADLAHDVRLLTLVRSVLGPGASPYRATLFDKSPVSNWLVVWHQDTSLPLCRRKEKPGWGPWSLKAGVIYAHAPTAALSRILALRVHLDESTLENGPLRVLPGTHARGVLSDADVSVLAQQSDAIDCLVPRGGVLAMRPLIVHASSKSRSNARRRVLHIEYAAAMTTDDGLELAIA